MSERCEMRSASAARRDCSRLSHDSELKFASVCASDTAFDNHCTRRFGCQPGVHVKLDALRGGALYGPSIWPHDTKPVPRAITFSASVVSM